MKKHRKQVVYVDGQKYLVDVPVDNELYKADNHADYQRRRSKNKHRSLQDVIFADKIANVMDDYEEKQLVVCLHEALQNLTEKERQLIEYLYYDGLTEEVASKILMVTQQAVSKQKLIVIAKLRNSLINWL